MAFNGLHREQRAITERIMTSRLGVLCVPRRIRANPAMGIAICNAATLPRPGEAMNKTAVYVRCARESSERIERQLQRCAEVAQRHGLRVDAATTFQDNGRSGKGRAELRPGYRRMTEALRAGLVSVVVVDDIRRLSRSVQELMEILKWFDVAGIRIVSAEKESFLYRSARRLLFMAATGCYIAKPFAGDAASVPRRTEIAVAIGTATANRNT
jgi:hypothetical protein